MCDRPLLEWVWQRRTDRGIRFVAANGDWHFHSYDHLATLTRRVARGLVAAGLRPHDVVALVQGSTPGFVASLFGTMLAGGVPAPMPPPHQLVTPDYWQRLNGLLTVVQPSFVLVDGHDAPPTLRAALSTATSAKTIAIETLLAADDDFDDADADRSDKRDVDPRAADLALLQFTSGSSGHCRAVRVPFAALEANLRMIQQWLHWTADDHALSWLPVHHDMGLVGCLINAIVTQCQFWLMTPEHFVRSPVRYLRCLSDNRAKLTAMPTFALDHIVRRVRPAALAGADFSACEAVIVGAEPLRAHTFAAFCDLLGPFGLRRGALRPAYGLAEATLAVTGLPLTETWTEIDIDPRTVALGARVVSADRPSASTPRGTLTSTLVGCGRPLADVTVTIQDDRTGAALPDGTFGEIVVHGPSVTAAYVHGSDAGETSFDQDGLRTGDIGFLQDGQLYVLGRLGDSIKVLGRALFAEDVESALARAGLASNRIAALLGWRDGRPAVVVLLERGEADWLTRADAILRPQIGDAALAILLVSAGTIRRTTSGKIRRRELWQIFRDAGADTDAAPALDATP